MAGTGYRRGARALRKTISVRKERSTIIITHLSLFISSDLRGHCRRIAVCYVASTRRRRLFVWFVVSTSRRRRRRRRWWWRKRGQRVNCKSRACHDLRLIPHSHDFKLDFCSSHADPPPPTTTTRRGDNEPRKQSPSSCARDKAHSDATTMTTEIGGMNNERCVIMIVLLSLRTEIVFRSARAPLLVSRTPPSTTHHPSSTICGKFIQA